MLWQLVDDGPKVAFIAALGGLTLLAGWLCLDRWSAVAARLRARWAKPATVAPALLFVLGLGSFGVIAEDVLIRQEQEWMLRLDARIRSASRAASNTPELRQAARYVTRATGEGLAVVVAGGAAYLWWRGRRREAFLFVGGVLGAWALSGLLKVVFAVPRPSASSAVNAVTKYGFPSAHALVTTAAVGLGVGVLRGRGLGVRLLLVGLAAAVVIATAASRIVLNAHWLSDVVAGIAIGLAWVGLVLLASRPPWLGGGPAQGTGPPALARQRP